MAAACVAGPQPAQLGQSGPLDGAQLFKKINTVLATCRREPLLDPPPLPVFGPNPVVGFAIREGKGGIALKLKVSRDVRWEARSALEDIMVFAWAPCNAGVAKHGLYAFLGLLPAPSKGESDITKLYLKKLEEWRKLKHKRYHIPLEGSRIFIRAWQQLNGWENDLGMFRANALTPGQEVAALFDQKGREVEEQSRNNRGIIEDESRMPGGLPRRSTNGTRQPPAPDTGPDTLHSR